MEHLEDPETVFGEINRVLKPGGIFLFKTPNRRHYMPLIAQLTPYRFHQFINKLRGRDSEDTFQPVIVQQHRTGHHLGSQNGLGGFRHSADRRAS